MRVLADRCRELQVTMQTGRVYKLLPGDPFPYVENVEDVHLMVFDVVAGCNATYLSAESHPGHAWAAQDSYREIAKALDASTKEVDVT